MARILVTGSVDGLGRNLADALLTEGHRVFVHGRTEERLRSAQDLLERGASALVGDLAVLGDVRRLAERVNQLEPLDAVVHNAGVIGGSTLLHVNVVAPYLLTTLIRRPRRLIYLSSGMHRGGTARVDDRMWSAEGERASYSDSKLFVTALSAAVARLWPDVLSNSVDPGWVPTRMGGAGAPDDLRLGHVTQQWLATSDEPAARTSGGYWRHQRKQRTHAAVSDVDFQNQLIESLARYTGVGLR